MLFVFLHHSMIDYHKLVFVTGVLQKRKRKSYLKVSMEVRKEIEEFYLDDSNSMMCSGTKECITLKEAGQSSKKVQKRLILYDLKNLYSKWVEETTPTTVPCLAFFTKLKPIQCSFAGEPGTHNICVCAIHQNIKLKLAAIRPDLNYKEVIASGVCSIENRNCMLGDCSDCPKEEAMENFLKTGIDMTNSKVIKYLQWSTKDEDGSSKR